jgi:adenylyl-sulfate kinase
MKRAIFIGRWSPFHKGHLAIMKDKIDAGIPLLILVRDTPYDIYPPLLRKRMIEAAMAKLKADAKVMIIDDIESVNYGRDVGYDVNEVRVNGDMKVISATAIRQMIENNDASWEKMMPDGAAKVLKDYLSSSGIVVWFTGLYKAGKTTIANIVSKELENRGIRSELIDGGVLRSTISKDLSFSKKDRELNLERAAYIAELLSRNGNIALCSFISPYRQARDKIRKQIEKHGTFIEVHVKASIDTCKSRDTEGMYAKAEKAEIEEFTGVSSPYQEPKNPELVLDTEKISAQESAGKVIELINCYIQNG